MAHIDTLTLMVIPNRFPEGSNSIEYSKVTRVPWGFSRVAALANDNNNTSIAFNFSSVVNKEHLTIRTKSHPIISHYHISDKLDRYNFCTDMFYSIILSI